LEMHNTRAYRRVNI